MRGMCVFCMEIDHGNVQRASAENQLEIVIVFWNEIIDESQ